MSEKKEEMEQASKICTTEPGRGVVFTAPSDVAH
jgi:hypothetical protein